MYLNAQQLNQFMDVFEQRLGDVFATGSVHLDGLFELMREAPAKRIRPKSMLLCAMLGSPEDMEKVLDAAIAVEMFHTAALIHDDVLDAAELRRGLPTAQTEWGNKITVLGGDYLVAKAFYRLAAVNEPAVLHMLLDAVATTCEGEIWQTEREHEVDLTEEEYLKIIRKKTAALISASCGAGALFGKLEDSLVDHLIYFGLNFGVAFQITDDITDLLGSPTDTGKPFGLDARCGRLTLPAIYALRTLEPQHAAMVRSLLGKNNLAAAQQYSQLVEQSGGVDYANTVAHRYAQTAREHLQAFDGAPGASMLGQILEESLARFQP